MATMVVWKQDVPTDPEMEFVWPMGAQILHGDIQNGMPRVWFRCDPSKPKVTRRFRLMPTGGEMEGGEAWIHRASFLFAGGELVFHLMELP
jgi:hypothetical protein